MRIVFLSNGYNHHQAFLSRNLFKLTDGDYHFFAVAPLTERRKQLGYPEIKDSFVRIFDGTNKVMQDIIDSADVVIHGSAPEEWLKKRKKQGKLIFRYFERPLKKGFQWWKYPYRFLKWHMKNPKNAPIYMLCASAYTAEDYSKFGLFKDRAFKWGYFPECKRYEDIDTLISQKTPNEILWCGRFLDWKHPDDVLKVAKRLKSDGYLFHITIIGTGEMGDELKALSDECDLSEYVTFVGAVSADKVRGYMEKASIYLFTSDRQEGWGAVLNEAMNSGCAVVASDAAGATPYLIKNEENGIVYPSENVECLYQSLKKLLDQPDLQLKLGINAYETITNEWNPEIAATRLVELIKVMISGEKYHNLYQTGPCSKA